MAKVFTTNALIDSIKRRISMPSNQSTFTDTDILAFANEEIALSLVPSILSLHEGHFLFEGRDPLVANKSEYRIPPRSIGNKLNELQYADTGDNRFEMTRISVGDIPHYQGTFVEDRAYNYYVQYNRVHLIPSIGGSVSGDLLFYYFISPNEMVAESRAAIITAIDTVTGIITVDKIPSHFTTDIEYDLYMAESPHRHLAINKSIVSFDTSAKTITFTAADLPSELAVGDHITKAEECIIPQVPADLHVLLAQYTAERLLEAQGDTQGLQNAKVKTREMENRAGNIIDNRVDEAPQKLVNRNGSLRFGLYRRRFRRRS